MKPETFEAIREQQLASEIFRFEQTCDKTFCMYVCASNIVALVESASPDWWLKIKV
jgi:hypothetical protein